MNTISKETELTSRFNRLPVYEDGYVESHRVARVLYRIVTNIDVDLIGLACFLRNSFEDADATAAELDGSVPEDAMTLAALAITPHPKDADVIFNEEGVEKWHRAILTSAVEERWLRLDPITLAPLINGEEQAFTSHMSTFLDWIRRFCSPSLLIAFENEIDWRRPKEPAGEQTSCDANDSCAARAHKPNQSTGRSDFLDDAITDAIKANPGGDTRTLWGWIIQNSKRWVIEYDKEQDTMTWSGKKRPTNYKAFEKRVRDRAKKRRAEADD